MTVRWRLTGLVVDWEKRRVNYDLVTPATAP